MTRTMLQKIVSAISNADIFCGTDEKSIKHLIDEHTIVKSFKNGETIFDENDSPCLCLLLKGTAQVQKEQLIISRLHENDLFGAVTLFNDCKNFVNKIVALSDCTVLFISKQGVESLIEKSPEFSKRYIAYLSKRIYFLNNRIGSFTKSNASDKMYSYLAKNSTNGQIVFESGITTLSKVLNISRASIYRAFEELEAQGKILKNGKTITILEEQKR